MGRLSCRNVELSSAEGPVRETTRFRTIAPYSPHRRFWFDASLERTQRTLRLAQAADVITLASPLPMRFE